MTHPAFGRLSTAYDMVNVSGRIYDGVLSQEALIRRTNDHLARAGGVVYPHQDKADGTRDTRGLPASTVIDLRTAFWQGATARAGAQRTHSAIGLSMLADATRMMGSEGMVRWGNHPLAVTIRASLPLRVAAWPLTLWNQNLLALAGISVSGTQLGSGLAEYIIGTGYEDRPAYPKNAPSYLVTVPPPFETFKTDGVLGLPERVVRQWAWDRREAAPRWACAALVAAGLLRVAKQPLALGLCAVWGCEILLGGMVGIAHVLANHVVNSLSLGVQKIGSVLRLNQPPATPCTLASFRRDRAAARAATSKPVNGPQNQGTAAEKSPHQGGQPAEGDVTQALLGESKTTSLRHRLERLGSAHSIQEHGQA